MPDPLADLAARLQEALAAEDWSVHDDEVEVALAMHATTALHAMVGQQMDVLLPTGVARATIADYEVGEARLEDGVAEVPLVILLRPGPDEIQVSITDG